MSKYIVYTLEGLKQDKPSTEILMPSGAQKELRESRLHPHAAEMEKAGYRATAIFEDLPMPYGVQNNE